MHLGRVLRYGALAAIGLAAHVALGVEPPQSLVLQLVINGRVAGETLDVWQRDGAVLALASELREAGIIVPESVHPDADGRIRLDALTNLSFRVDELKQQLVVTADARGVTPNRIGPEHRTELLPLETGTGAVLDYTLNGTYQGGHAIGAGAFAGWVFSPYGVFDSGFLTYAGAGTTFSSANTVTRLGTTYTYSDADSLRRYRLGDVITGALDWTRPVRLGGIQLATDFQMRPDLITFPLPTLAGTVAVPSTIDVLVNGTRQFSSQVEQGPFAIPQLPVVTGQGNVSMVITDPVGRQVVENLPYYASSNLLAEGLSSLSFEAGSVRLNYGLRSNDYQGEAASASGRYGLTDDVTVEGHAEGTSQLGMGGAGGAVAIGSLGVLSFSGAGSHSFGQSGYQLGVGFQHQTQGISLSASTLRASQSFRDIAAVYGQPSPSQITHLSVGFPLGDFGSLALAYSVIDQSARANFRGTPIQARAASNALGFLFPVTEHARLLTGSWSKTLFGRLSVYATAYKDLSHSQSLGAFLGISLPFGSRDSVSASAAYTGSGFTPQVQSQRSVRDVGDLGWQAVSSYAGSPQAWADVDYKSPWALLDVGAARAGSSNAARAGAQGSLAFADGGLFAANTITDSFAVIDTGEATDVGVQQDNRSIGRTNGSGQLLVPDLRSFQENRIGIDPRDVPLDANLDSAIRTVRPQDRSGVTVRFAIKSSKAALLKLVDSAGKPIPLGSTVQLSGTGQPQIVGYDGEAYLEGLSESNTVVVTAPDGRTCRVSFAYKKAKGELPEITPAPCRLERSP
ncbi:MAG: fimbrial biogenesis outer membrane usher protein [Acetobacteraceae bacterium]|nr:fimbrial biogenesis outer membrane usher protein [Acetobacteraceae bacterium]